MEMCVCASVCTWSEFPPWLRWYDRYHVTFPYPRPEPLSSAGRGVPAPEASSSPGRRCTCIHTFWLTRLKTDRLTVMNLQCVSHLWQSGCEMTLTIVSTAVSNSSGLDSAAKQSWTSSWLSPNGTSSPTQLERQRSTFSFTLLEESWLWRSWRSMGHTTAHSPARASLSWARRAWARRLLWNSSGRMVRSSSRVRQWAWGSWVASAPEPPSLSGFCGWKARTMSATGRDQACGIKFRAIAARATHSLVSTILGPWEKCRMWERSCILRPSCWSAGRSLQWREILVWRVLAPKNCTSGSCEKTERKVCLIFQLFFSSLTEITVQLTKIN